MAVIPVYPIRPPACSPFQYRIVTPVSLQWRKNRIKFDVTVQTEVIGYVSVFWSVCDRDPVQIDINGTCAVHTVIGKKKIRYGSHFVCGPPLSAVWMWPMRLFWCVDGKILHNIKNDFDGCSDCKINKEKQMSAKKKVIVVGSLGV